MIRNLKFRLLPPADDEWSKGILNDALTSGSLLGQIWKGKYERAITKASADPIDKRKLQSMKKKKMEAEDSEMSVAEKRKQRMKDMADDDQPKKKKKKMSNRDECDDPNLSPREKKRCRMKKK